MLFEISLTGTAPVKYIQKVFTVIFLYLIVIRIFQVKIQVFTVYRSNTCCILRLFHTSLDFKRSNTCFDNFRENIKGTDIFQV